MTPFEVVDTGTGATGPAPVTPRNLPNRGGDANPSAQALQEKFGGAIKRAEVVWGETTVFVDPASVNAVIR